jgi:flagellar motor switch/type III secretory pathway protein FliN
VEVIPAGSAFNQLPDGVLQISVSLGGDDLSVLVVPRPLLLLLLGGMFHESEESLQGDREFTPVEASLIPFVVEHFFLGPLEQSCPFGAPLNLRPETNPTAPRPGVFPPEALVVAAGFEVQSSWQVFTWSWALARKGWLGRFADAGTSSAGTKGDAPPDTEPVVRELPLEVRVLLGAVDCSLLQLAALAPGDLFLLEQPVGEPLKAAVEGKVMFRVWPGAVGARQAVEIQSLIEP